MLNTIDNLVYSHSEYFDVLKPFLSQHEKYGLIPIIAADEQYSPNYRHVYYDDSLAYTDKLKSCLQQLTAEFVIYQHEDMFLYHQPNLELVEQYQEFLEKNNYSFIRLGRTGNCKLTYKCPKVFAIKKHSADFFAAQPTLWNRKHFIKFLKRARGLSIWDLERRGHEFNKDIRGFLHFDNETARGGHFDSSVWPYVATAIVKGKWNFREYRNELRTILGKHMINETDRGTV